jgi:hypothetical protein
VRQGRGGPRSGDRDAGDGAAHGAGGGDVVEPAEGASERVGCWSEV